jgi:RsiW-degrading membrane proteinase PrsW (M82 family)
VNHTAQEVGIFFALQHHLHLFGGHAVLFVMVVYKVVWAAAHCMAAPDWFTGTCTTWQAICR